MFVHLLEMSWRICNNLLSAQSREIIRLCLIWGDGNRRETSVCVNVIDWRKDWWSAVLQLSAKRCLYLFDLTVLKQQCRELGSHHPACPLRLNKQTICLEQISPTFCRDIQYKFPPSYKHITNKHTQKNPEMCHLFVTHGGFKRHAKRLWLRLWGCNMPLPDVNGISASIQGNLSISRWIFSFH